MDEACLEDWSHYFEEPEDQFLPDIEVDHFKQVVYNNIAAPSLLAILREYRASVRPLQLTPDRVEMVQENFFRELARLGRPQCDHFVPAIELSYFCEVVRDFIRDSGGFAYGVMDILTVYRDAIRPLENNNERSRMIHTYFFNLVERVNGVYVLRT